MKVLLALDGSPASDCVLNELKRINLDKDSEVYILSIVEPVRPIMAEPYGGAMIEYEAAIEEQNRIAANLIIGKAKESISKDFGCKVTTEIISGSPKYVIVDKSKEMKVDFVIVGSHGYRLWERVLLGSVSTFVAQHADCSVIISRCKK